MVEQARRPTGIRNRNGRPSAEHDHIEIDIETAARTLSPVLITAQPGRALAISRAIAARRADEHTNEVLVCDPVAGDAAMGRLAKEALANAARNGTAIVLFREVGAWDAVEQAAIMNLLANRQPHSTNGGPSIVVSSSISLYERVLQGTFDDQLFYRLNTVHIVDVPDGNSHSPGSY